MVFTQQLFAARTADHAIQLDGMSANRRSVPQGPSGSEQSLQPLLHDFVARALGGRREPRLYLGDAHRVGHARTPGLHIQVARGTRRAIVLAERADRQDHRFVERLRLDVHGMANAVGAGERDSTGSGGHEESIS